MELFGQIDLAVLGNIVRSHPEAVKTVTLRDGTTHKYLNISVSERRTPDQFGRTHYIRAGIRKDQQKPGVNYYVADLKESQQQAPVAPQPAPTAPPQQGEEGDLPF